MPNPKSSNKILPLLFLLLTFSLYSITTPVNIAFAAPSQTSIAVVVNDDAISYLDIEQRTSLIIASSGLPDTQETKDKLRPQIVSSLIEESLQRQEAARLNLSATEEKINQEFAALARSNKMSADEFESRLKAAGVSVSSLRRQIEARLLWSEVFGNSLRRQVRISDIDVSTYRQQLENHIGKTEYLLSEIFLPVDQNSNAERAQQLAQKVVADIRAQKASFQAVAQQISRSPGAMNGGTLGWVLGDQLEPAIEKAVAQMPARTISSPLKTLDGYRIYLLSDKRTVAAENIPDDEQIRQTLFAQRAERVSRNALKTLRHQAFIENRLEAQDQ